MAMKTDTDKMKILVKTHSRNEEFTVSEIATVAEIKPEIAQRFDAEADQLCLIYAGKLLNDTKTLVAQNVKDGFAIHLVIRGRGQQQQQQQPPPPPPRETRIQNEASPLNDITSNLLSNPEYIRTLIAMNPRLQEYLEQNPDIAHAINNPNVMREYIQIAANPNMMQEFLRGQDLTMRNLENMPGGFAALQSMYNNISELESTVTNMQSPPSFMSPPPTPTDANMPNVNPLPNPWITESSAGSPLGSANIPDPQMLSQMLNNPQIQQIMRDLASDPNFLQTVVNNNPNLTDPTMQTFLQTNLATVLQSLQTLQTEDDMRTILSQMQVNSPPQTPENLYSHQLEQLNMMGFTDKDANLRALVQTLGDINAAIDLLSGV